METQRALKYIPHLAPIVMRRTQFPGRIWAGMSGVFSRISHEKDFPVVNIQVYEHSSHRDSVWLSRVVVHDLAWNLEQ